MRIILIYITDIETSVFFCTMKLTRTYSIALGCVFAALFSQAQAQNKELNLYSARHYQTDEALYANFTAQTGIKINRIEAGDEALLERLRSEGGRSQADVILLVDASRLWRAQIDGLFSPVRSAFLNQRVPENFRGVDDGKGIHWFGISTRARVIVYNKSLVNPTTVQSYEDLSNPALKGKVCTRSGAHPYMLSLIGAVSERSGEAKATEWAKALVSNFARKPRGGDTDQIVAVSTGECAVALTNTYYLVRLMRSQKPADREVVSKVGVVFPNQSSSGTHVNISGAGIAKNSPNREAAIKFMEYLLSDSAQNYLAEGNNEWPVVKGMKPKNPELLGLGEFKVDVTPLASIGRAQISAQRIIDASGWR